MRIIIDADEVIAAMTRDVARLLAPLDDAEKDRVLAAAWQARQNRLEQS